MKIIISPSKTQKIKLNKNYNCTNPEFMEQAIQINSFMKTFSKEQLKDIYKASDAIVDDAYKNIQAFENADYSQAIFFYTGYVYSNIGVENFDNRQMNYLNETLRILSAHYGILRPLDAIKPYRLDYNMKVEGLDLKQIWQTKVNEALGDDLIINLASKEFSSLINKPMITIDFKEYKNGKYIVKGTYAKMARGAMVGEIVRRRIETPEQIKKIKVNWYEYNKELSTESNYVFTIKN